MPLPLLPLLAAASTNTPFYQLAILAVIASCPPAWAVVRSTRSTHALRADIATNDGKRPGEYLEMIAGIQNGQTMMRARVDDLAAGQGEHAAHLRSLELAFADHTVADEVYRSDVTRAQKQHEESQEQQARDVAEALKVQTAKVRLALDAQEEEVRGALQAIVAAIPPSSPPSN